MGTNSIGLNQVFPIYNEDRTPFHNLVLRRGVVDSVVMSLGDKITGDVYYKDNTLEFTMKEYVVYKDIRYSLITPPTIVREGMVADNGELKGMTKYSFEFYHPMCQLANFPFTDVATKPGEEKYLSQNKSFSWIGKPQDYIDKLNKNLQGTVWYVRKSDRFPVEKDDELSDVLTFDNVTIADAIKTGYETWDIPYVVSQLPSTDPLYVQDKQFVVEYGLPSNEIYESESARQLDTPFVFQMGQGVGLKNNSRTPRNNKIVTRIAGYGSEDNVPYGYPQIVWTGNQNWDYTIDNDPNNPLSYPIYKGIIGGQYVKLIKHPFTRTHLMPSIYTETVNKKVNPNAVGYNPNIEIKDYYDAIATQEYHYTNEINPQAPSYESHEFADIKPELDADRNTGIVSAIPLDKELHPTDKWDDTMDDDGKYLQSYFQITLPQLDFDLYACAAITQEMQINMRSGACIGCTFTVQVDWDDYKANFYDSDGNFLPDGKQRNLIKYPKSNLKQIKVVVQKDNNTFGKLMPNIYQQPKADDLFVFIGISLPLSYITSAETRLDSAMKSYMLENNVYYFDYPLKFDEHFLATHTYILEQIRPNSIIHFDYGGVEQQLFVKQLTVKYGNAPLPQYDITLTDNIEVVLNQIGQVEEDVEHVGSLISILRQQYGRNVWNELSKKLSKANDDTAQGEIGFLKGLWIKTKGLFGFDGDGNIIANMISAVQAFVDKVQSTNYQSGELTGSGWQMTNDDGSGRSRLEVDNLIVRMKFIANVLEARKYVAIGGNYVYSPAASVIERVDYFDANGNLMGYQRMRVPLLARIAGRLLPVRIRQGIITAYKTIEYSGNIDMTKVATFRCWLLADDGTTKTVNTWHKDMLARCQTLNVDEIKERTDGGSGYSGEGSEGDSRGNVYYWRLVTAAGTTDLPVPDGKQHHYVDLSNKNGEYDELSMNPQAGDSIVCFGGKKAEYSHLIVIETTGENAPALRQLDKVGLYDDEEREGINWSLDGKERVRISPHDNMFNADSFIVNVDEFILKTTGGNSITFNQFIVNQEGIWLGAVNDNLEQVGIHIDGDNSNINLFADKTTFATSDGTPMIAVQMCDTDGNVGEGSQYNIPSIVFYNGRIGDDGVSPQWVLNYLGFISATNAGVRYSFTGIFNTLCFDEPSGSAVEHKGVSGNYEFNSTDMADRTMNDTHYIEPLYLFNSGYYINPSGQKTYQPADGVHYEKYNHIDAMRRYWLTQAVSNVFVPDDNNNATAEGYYFVKASDSQDYYQGKGPSDNDWHKRTPVSGNGNDPVYIVSAAVVYHLVYFNPKADPDEGIANDERGVMDMLKNAFVVFYEGDSNGNITKDCIGLIGGNISFGNNPTFKASPTVNDIIDEYNL